MKKTIILLAFAVIAFSSTYAQCIKTNTNLINLNVGTLGFNSIEGKIEHLFTDKVGIGCTVLGSSGVGMAIMANFNLHFETTERFGAFFQVGAGGSVEENIPIMRIGVGMYYFLSPKFGLNLDMGFGGGGILKLGLSFKFNKKKNEEITAYYNSNRINN